MAIGFDAFANTGSNMTLMNPFTWVHNCAGSDRLLCVDFGVYGSISGISGVTYGGVALTKVGQVTAPGPSQYSLYSYRLIAPATGSGTISVTTTGGFPFGYIGESVSYTGVHQSNPTEGLNIGSGQTPGTGSGDLSLDVTTTFDNDWVRAAFLSDSSQSGVCGQTQRSNIYTFSGLLADEDFGPQTPVGTKSMTFNGIGTNKYYASLGYGLIPVGAGTPASSGLNLFIKGYDVSSGNFPMCVVGHELSSGSLDLFIKGYDASSGSLDFYIFGVGTEVSGALTLYTSGEANPQSGNFPLFIGGYEPSSGNFDLYLFGEANPQSGNFPLFINSIGAESGWLSLHTIAANYGSGLLPFTLITDDIPSGIESLTFFMHGSSQSGNFAGLNLFTYCDESGNRPYAGLNMSLIGADDDSISSNMNLWIGGQNKSIESNFNLFIENTQSGINNSFAMYVSGEGVTAGLLPSSGSLNMVLMRDPANSTTLYIQGPGDENASGIWFTTLGGYHLDSSINFSIPDILGYNTNRMSLWTHGY